MERPDSLTRCSDEDLLIRFCKGQTEAFGVLMRRYERELFGYDATAEVLDDWMYEQLAAAYLLDDEVRAFVRRANPWAERAMIERLLEAAERGLWERPEAETLARLRAQHGENEAWLEGG